MNDRDYVYFDIREHVGPDIFETLPFSIRVVLENLVRNLDRPGVTRNVIAGLINPNLKSDDVAVPLYVPRIVLPDSTGVPALIDLAALRSAVAQQGRDPSRVDAHLPVDLIVDHSMQVDRAGEKDAEQVNLALEYQRNEERYRFLKWAASSFSGLRIFPPGTGIIHQVHLEQIATVVRVDASDGDALLFPDAALGGDSHTTMINALGIMGWGVGGIEAEAALLGEPYIMAKPETVGVRLVNGVRPGITFTDVALTITERLRAAKVVGAFVEYSGPAYADLSVPDRATLANMAPEYGATMGFFPVDEQTLAYLALTGRTADQLRLIEAYTRGAGLFRARGDQEPNFDRTIEFDLSEVGRTISGPGKPYVRQTPASVVTSFQERLEERRPERAGQSPNGDDGLVAIAAITSCTNTANPKAMICAGLLASKAIERGLVPRSWVKTSLAPGSRAVTRYLLDSGLLSALESLGFGVVGYGCATCGGKSGPIKAEMEQAARDGKTLVAVLSGNRNFDGRIHRYVGASYLCSPAMVIAYALTGRIDVDLESAPLGNGHDGKPVRLQDIWPSEAEIDAIQDRYVTSEVYRAQTTPVEGTVKTWAALRSEHGHTFSWDENSSYIVEPPFFVEQADKFALSAVTENVRALGIFEDGIPTDHISPGGEIPEDSPAGRYLLDIGIEKSAFNTYVGRRGNHHVMARATFSNNRIRNRMAGGKEGWWTRLHPEGELATMFDASMAYKERGTPLIVLAEASFGVGSSRDWAAKGQALLGIVAVLARSFERIHRSNLIGVGITPLVFEQDRGPTELGLDGSEEFRFEGIDRAVRIGGPARVIARHSDGRQTSFTVAADLRSQAERDLLLRGGIFISALRRALETGRDEAVAPSVHDAQREKEKQ